MTDQKFRAALSELAREFVDAMVADLLRGLADPPAHRWASSTKRANRMNRYGERKRLGLCVTCGSPANGKARCQGCGDRQLVYQARWLARKVAP